MASPVMPIDYVSSIRNFADLFNGVCKPVAGVAGSLIAIDAEMQMRTIGTTCLTDASYQFPGFYMLPFGYMQLLQMDIEGNNALSMIDGHTIAVKLETGSSQNYDTRSACHYR